MRTSRAALAAYLLFAASARAEFYPVVDLYQEFGRGLTVGTNVTATNPGTLRWKAEAPRGLQVHDGTSWGGFGGERGVVSVLEYGAVGDGTGDCSGAFNAALAAASSNASGGIVSVPPGTYRMERRIVLPSRTWLRGSGDSSVLKLADPIDGVRQFRDASFISTKFGVDFVENPSPLPAFTEDVVVSDLSLDLGAPGAISTTLWPDGTARGYLHDSISGLVSLWGVERLVLRNLSTPTNTQKGPSIIDLRGACRDVSITGCRIYNAVTHLQPDVGGAIGIRGNMYAGGEKWLNERISIRGNDLFSSGSDETLAVLGWQVGNRDVLISGNTIRATGSGYGVFVYGGGLPANNHTGWSSRISVEGNNILGAVRVLDGASDVLVANNTIRVPTNAQNTSGASIYGSMDAVFTGTQQTSPEFSGSPLNVAISGNHIAGAGRWGLGLLAGAPIAIGNSISGAGSGGVQGGGSVLGNRVELLAGTIGYQPSALTRLVEGNFSRGGKYGLQSFGSLSRARIAGNYFEDCVDGGVVLNAGAGASASMRDLEIRGNTAYARSTNLTVGFQVILSGQPSSNFSGNIVADNRVLAATGRSVATPYSFPAAFASTARKSGNASPSAYGLADSMFPRLRGTTAQRPDLPGQPLRLGAEDSGHVYYDTSVGEALFWTGTGWISLGGGAGGGTGSGFPLTNDANAVFAITNATLFQASEGDFGELRAGTIEAVSITATDFSITGTMSVNKTINMSTTVYMGVSTTHISDVYYATQFLALISYTNIISTNQVDTYVNVGGSFAMGAGSTFNATGATSVSFPYFSATSTGGVVASGPWNFEGPVYGVDGTTNLLELGAGSADTNRVLRPTGVSNRVAWFDPAPGMVFGTSDDTAPRGSWFAAISNSMSDLTVSVSNQTVLLAEAGSVESADTVIPWASEITLLGGTSNWMQRIESIDGPTTISLPAKSNPNVSARIHLTIPAVGTNIPTVISTSVPPVVGYVPVPSTNSVRVILFTSQAGESAWRGRALQ